VGLQGRSYAPMVIRAVRKLGRLLRYGGFRGPKPYEVEVLNATVAALPEADARALTQQVELIERLQRWNDDRMVIVGFEDKRALEPLENQGLDYCLAKLRLKGDLGSVTAIVMTHRGVLSSLEFLPSPRKAAGQDVSVELVSLYSGDPGESVAVDAGEHGALAAPDRAS
jgi:hypothetical protein